MLEKLFHKKNIVFEKLDRIGEIWVLHLLWLLCSIPLITIGASTSALFYSMLKLRAKEGKITANFFKSFRENLVQAVCLLVIYGGIGTVLGVGILKGGQAIRIGAFILAIPYLMSLIYIFAIQAKFANTTKNLMFYSLIVPIRHWMMTLQMMLCVGLVGYLNYQYRIANYLMLGFGVGVIAYYLSGYFQKIFVHYIPNSNPQIASANEETDQ